MADAAAVDDGIGDWPLEGFCAADSTTRVLVLDRGSTWLHAGMRVWIEPTAEERAAAIAEKVRAAHARASQRRRRRAAHYRRQPAGAGAGGSSGFQDDDAAGDGGDDDAMVALPSNAASRDGFDSDDGEQDGYEEAKGGGGGGDDGDFDAPAAIALAEQEYDAEREFLVARVDVAERRCVLQHPLAFEPAGRHYMTCAAEATQDLSSWLPVQAYACVQALYAATTNPELARSADAQWDLFNSAYETPRDGSPEDVDRGWTVLREWLHGVQQRALALRVLGDVTPRQLKLWANMQHVLYVFCNVYESLRASKVVERAVLTGGASTTDTYVSPYWYRVEPPADEQPNTQGELFLYLLAQAQRDGLRKVGDVVYRQILTWSYSWRPRADNPLCRVPGCGSPACYGLPEGGPSVAAGVRVACEEHADDEELVDLRWVPVGMGAARAGGAGGAGGPGGAGSGAAAGGREMRADESVRVQYCTRTWQPMFNDAGSVVNIDAWVEIQMNCRLTRTELWNKWTRSYQANKAACVAFLTGTQDPAFPVYVGDGSLFAFQNGVYSIADDGTEQGAHGRFMPYDGDCMQWHQVCCINFIDEWFDPRLARLPLDHPLLDVPGLNTILASQNYDAPMATCFKAFHGRLFYPLRQHDRWEKQVVTKGFGATGKSSIARAIMMLLGARNVGVIPSNCEEQWALASAYDRRLWVCLELKADFRLNTGVLQCMVSGETVAIHIKNKTQFDMLWSAPGLMMGNEIPTSWQSDAMNALYRRILPFPFDLPPKKVDVTVGPRLMSALSTLLVSLTRNYKALVRRVGAESIDPFLPPRLRESSESFRRVASPMLPFLEGDTNQVDMAPLDLRQSLLRLLVDHMNVEPRALARSPEEIATFEPLPILQAQRLLAQWSIDASDLQAEWSKPAASSLAVSRRPAITSPDNYRPVIAALYLGVAKIHGKIKWVGVRLSSGFGMDGSGGGGGGSGGGGGAGVGVGAGTGNSGGGDQDMPSLFGAPAL